MDFPRINLKKIDLLKEATDNFFNLKDSIFDYEVSTHSDDWAIGSERLLCFENRFNLDNEGNLDCCLALYKNNKATILRDATFKISPTIFLPQREDTGIGIEGKNTISSVVELFKNTRPLFLKFAEKRSYYPYIVPFQVINPEIEDDLGRLFFDFEDLDCLKTTKVPKTLKDQSYTLVGVYHQTPYAKTTDTDCILFAETNNVYDSHAIKVLRWFPPIRKMEYDPILERFEPTPPIPQHEGIRTYGYISRDENTSLHEFMINNSRILFGKVTNEKIKIIGGIEAFIDGDLKDRYFPHCLLEFVKL